MNAHTFSVLLAGGVGSRFWPVSRALRPKQLLDLFGEGPMLRRTFERVADLAPPERTIVVTSGSLAPAVRALLPEVPPDRILAEPSGKNTAPAIAWAATVARRLDPDATLMVLPADHHIADVPAFRATLERALAHAHDHLVTIGIVPTHPETGYGYIQRGAAHADGARSSFAFGGAGAYRVAAFAEKPDLATAARYLAGGEHLWNAGMFFMRADLYLAELARHRPALAAQITAADDVLAVWSELESISIDYAVMERSDRILVVPGSFGWSDVGSWRSLADHAQGPSFHHGDVLELDGTGNVLFAEHGLVVTVGVSDLVVVHTADATLVCPRDAAQRTREIVQALERAGRKDLL